MASKYKVEITGKDKSMAAFRSMKRSMGSAERSMASFTSAFGVALGAGGIAASFGLSVKAASDFEKKISEISTLLDDTSSIDKISDSIRGMAVEFGGDVITQSSAMYQIISAGAESTAEAVDILTISNKLAVGGVTDVAIAADGLTSTLNAYGDQVSGATEVSDAFFVAVKAGKTTVEELSANIGAVAPIAAQTGVSLDELLAATATLTKGGVSTSEAMTGLRGVMAAVLKPMDKARKTAKRLGIDFSLTGLKAKGLSGFLKDITEKTGGSATEMAALFGRVEGLTKVLALSGSQAEDYTEILGKFKDKVGETDVAFEKMTKTFDYQFNQLIANFKDVGISIGDGMLPPLARAIERFNELFSLFRLDIGLLDKASGYFNALGKVIGDVAERLGLAGEPLRWFSKALVLATTSAEDLTKANSEMQKSVSSDLDRLIKDASLFTVSMERQAKRYKEASGDLDKLMKTSKLFISVTEDLTKSKAELAAILKEENKEFAEFAKALKAETDAEFKAKLSTISYTKKMEDQIKVLRVRVEQGDLAARVEEDWIRAQEENLNVGSDQIKSYYDQIGALEDMISNTESAAEQWGKIWDNAVVNMQREFSTLVYGAMFEDGIKSFEDFAGTLLNIFKKMIAEMVAAWLTQGIAKMFAGGGLSGFSIKGAIANTTASSVGTAASGGGGLIASAGSVGASLSGSLANGASIAESSVAAFESATAGADVTVYALGSDTAITGTELTSLAKSAETAATSTDAMASSSSTAGGAAAAWGIAAVAAYIAIAGAIKAAKIDKENAKMTEEFNRLRTETNAFAGEGVKVSDTLSVIGDEMGALYVRASADENGLFPDVSTFYDQITEVGAQLRYIYDDAGEAIAMITGNIEDAQSIIEQGFDNATLSFSTFQGATEGGLTSMTAAFRGSAEQWKNVMQSAMDSGAVSSQASFQIIEDDAGNTFIRMQGQANEWANYLASQGRIASESFANSMNYMFAEGDNMFGNLTGQALAFQQVINSIRGPSLSGNISVGNTPGFADGGSFIVGGSGGTDSQLAQFRVTPGERVTVETPAQQRAGQGGGEIIINMSGDMGGLERFIRVTADDHRVKVNRSGLRSTEPAF